MLKEATSPQIRAEQHSIAKSIVLHLLPAAVWLIFYVPLARIASEHDIPTMLIMYILVGVILVPIELGYLYYQGKKRNGKLSLKGVVLYREKMPWWQYIAFGLISLAWVAFILLVVGSSISDLISSKLLSWIPDWYHIDKGSVEQNQPWMELSMWILSLIFIAIIGPIAEELYFRGYLLPRLSRIGKWAPLVNVALFILYHFWQPQLLVTGIVGLLPWVYIVWWKRNIYLSVGLHCTINSLGWVMDLIQRLGAT